MVGTKGGNNTERATPFYRYDEGADVYFYNTLFGRKWLYFYEMASQVRLDHWNGRKTRIRVKARREVW